MHTSYEWTQAEAIELCRKVEAICPAFGCHVGLTGGCLYKEGPRKDVDLVFYRIRQVPQIDVQSLLLALGMDLGLEEIKGFGFCYKATIGERGIDMFFPEEFGGDYDEVSDTADRVTTADLLESWHRADERELAIAESNQEALRRAGEEVQP